MVFCGDTKGAVIVEKIKAFVANTLAFFGDVGEELKKSSWPTRSELIDSTRVVILSVMALALFVALSDFVLMKILKLIL